MNSPNRSERWSDLLRDWRLSPPRDPVFRAAVWARIQNRSGNASWGGYVRTRAPLVAGALLAAIVLGGWVGREQARTRVEADRAQIATAYVQSLDARLMVMP